MNLLSGWLTITDPNAPTDPSKVYYSPGTIGFIMTFIVAGLSVLLIFDMVRRIRRVRYRAEIQEKLAAEQEQEKAPTKKPTAKKKA